MSFAAQTTQFGNMYIAPGLPTEFAVRSCSVGSGATDSVYRGFLKCSLPAFRLSPRSRYSSSTVTS